jgi:hypothetical protein
MELYIEDSEFRPGHPLHWDLPNGLHPPSSSGPPRRGPRPMPPGRFGQLITIGREAERDAPYAGEIEAFCERPEEIIQVIQGFSDITALYINSHANPDRRSREAEGERRRGIQLGGTIIYAEHLRLFRAIRPNFNRWMIFDRSIISRDLFCHYNPEMPPGRRSIAQTLMPSITPRIVVCGCAIAQDHNFCQRLADEAETYVFGATIDQYAGQRSTMSPWTLHGPVLVFIPSSNFGVPEWSTQNVSPFNRRLGQQRIATGSGRGLGRISRSIGLA